MKQILTILVVATFLSFHAPVSQQGEVAIGNQIWMSENLGVTSFQNGDPLKYCWNAEEWIKAIEEERPAYAYFNFDPKNGVDHGCIYNYYVVHDKRPLPPEGWRVPRHKDLEKLRSQSPNLAYMLRSKGNQKEGTGLWTHQNFAFKEQQDLLGFNALPSGKLLTLESTGMVQFVDWGTSVSWWTESKGKTTKDLQQCWTLRQNFGGMQLEIGRTSPKYSGHYIRCIKKT